MNRSKYISTCDHFLKPAVLKTAELVLFRTKNSTNAFDTILRSLCFLLLKKL